MSDFPKTILQHHEKITLLPHLGGNTVEALSHSSNLILQNLLDFLEAGTVRSSVNYPQVDLPFVTPHRLTFFFHSRETTWTDIETILSAQHLQVRGMMNNSRDGYGYTIVNTDMSQQGDQQISQLMHQLQGVEGMIRVRHLENANIENWQ